MHKNVRKTVGWAGHGAAEQRGTKGGVPRVRWCFIGPLEVDICTAALHFPFDSTCLYRRPYLQLHRLLQLHRAVSDGQLQGWPLPCAGLQE